MNNVCQKDISSDKYVYVMMTRNVPNKIVEYVQMKKRVTPDDLVRSFKIRKNTAYNYLSRMRSKGILVKTGYGQYELESAKTSSLPVSNETRNMNSLIKSRMPTLDFTIWSTEDVGYFTHDTMGKNAIIIETVPSYLEPLRDLLAEKGYRAVTNPTKDIMKNIFEYFDRPVLIFGRKEKYATEMVDGLRRPTAERLIADLYYLIDRKRFQFPLSEFLNVVSEIMRTRSLNFRMLRRYAERRGVWSDLEKVFYLVSRNDPELDLPEKLIENGRKSVEPVLAISEGLR